MRVQFYIRFHTNPGESLFVTGDVGLPLVYLDSQFWYGSIEVDTSKVVRLSYSYVLQTRDGERIDEGGQGRVVDLSKTGVEELQLIDTWNAPGEFENVFYTDAFSKVLLRENETKVKVKSPKSFTHIFRVKAPLLLKNEVVCLLGHSPVLGEWNMESPVLLSREQDWWTLKINLPRESLPLVYKYGVYNIKTKKFQRFEEGENRLLHGDPHNRKLTIVHDGFIHLPNSSWKGAGVSIPVFSLRSRNSFGVGEFNDLKLLADWARATGLKLVQLLPVNDTISTKTYTDSYPYSAISAFALHPLYLNLPSMAGKHDGNIIKSIGKKQKQLNELGEVDYEQVIKFKLSVAREIFQLHRDSFLKNDDFKSFFEESKDWLIPYAAFCYLRDRNNTADFTKWKLYSVYNKEAIEKYVSPRARHYDEIAFQYFLQYHLHLQLREAVQYAHKLGVIIKGDIPIGVSPRSVETWTQPELFHMNRQSGAPPDDFAVKGQNWEFPTYNWEKMGEDHFQWWRRRFENMAKYFDAFRIDHILGFFRIWNIPVESVQGIMGFFSPAIPVHIYEFAQRGMWFNYYRFCKPYITDAVLWELFGPNKDKFLAFLEATGNNHYIIKPAFETQRQVQQYFATLADDDENRNIRDGLYELISNVILFEVEESNGQQFHFRISMESTTSFRHLDSNIQQQMRAMYDDYFYRRQDDFWRKEALKKLPSLKRSTNMLVCGEDLGMVPRPVPQVMKQLGILSLEIQRMPKDPSRKFFHPADAPYFSVVTPSTHDMSTIRTWWQENRELTQQFFNNELGQWGDSPEICEDWINKAIVIQHLYSPAMWSVFQLQDLMGMSNDIRRENHEAERINIPAIFNHYWRYRMHINLEQLLREKDFNEELRKYVEASGRL